MKIYDPKKILVPVDFSEMSRGALKAGVDIGEKWGAEVHAIHVAKESDHRPSVPGYASYGYEPYRGNLPAAFDVEKILEDARLELESRLQDMLRHVGAGPRVRGSVVWGNPLREILRHAESGDFDLIVMATHGRRGLSRFLLGSVAEQVIRRAPCPVFVVRAKVAQQRIFPVEVGEAALN